MGLAGLAERLEHSALGAWARGSEAAYPLANLVHLLGLVMLVGAIGVVDLRFIGLFRRLPAGPLAQGLIPVAASGLVLMIASGFVMFSADSVALSRSAVFRWKLGAIAAALANLAAFHVMARGRIADWGPRTPVAARAAAAASLALWLTAAALGRLIAYT